MHLHPALFQNLPGPLCADSIALHRDFASVSSPFSWPCPACHAVPSKLSNQQSSPRLFDLQAFAHPGSSTTGAFFPLDVNMMCPVIVLRNLSEIHQSIPLQPGETIPSSGSFHYLYAFSKEAAHSLAGLRPWAHHIPIGLDIFPQTTLPPRISIIPTLIRPNTWQWSFPASQPGRLVPKPSPFYLSSCQWYHQPCPLPLTREVVPRQLIGGYLLQPSNRQITNLIATPNVELDPSDSLLGIWTVTVWDKGSKQQDVSKLKVPSLVLRRKLQGSLTGKSLSQNWGSGQNLIRTRHLPIHISAGQGP